MRYGISILSSLLLAWVIGTLAVMVTSSIHAKWEVVKAERLDFQYYKIRKCSFGFGCDYMSKVFTESELEDAKAIVVRLNAKEHIIGVVQ